MVQAMRTVTRSLLPALASSPTEVALLPFLALPAGHIACLPPCSLPHPTPPPLAPFSASKAINCRESAPDRQSTCVSSPPSPSIAPFFSLSLPCCYCYRCAASMRARVPARFSPTVSNGMCGGTTQQRRGCQIRSCGEPEARKCPARRPPRPHEPHKGGEWRCPGCQTRRLPVPTAYCCFCNAVPSPVPLHISTPHSCASPCARVRPACALPCLLLCHPGPCPPVPHLHRRQVWVPKRRGAGAEVQ
jgi:hypothetical protein